jgi:hypothetical protein
MSRLRYARNCELAVVGLALYESEEVNVILKLRAQVEIADAPELGKRTKS